MVTMLIAAALAGLSGATPPSSALPLPDAKPAMWVVNDDDTVIFLFGTFHALDGRADWFNDEVMTAFEASDELVLETIVPPAEAKAGPLPSRQQARRHPVAPTASFLASTRMAISAGRANGMKVEKGADEMLRKAAEAAGKPVAGLEPFEEQLEMLVAMPSAAPAPSPVAQIHAMQGMSQVMSAMQAAWNRGDQAVFASVVEQLRQSAPDTYRVMFTNRNANWAWWIAQRMQKPGTVFVAVGAGHLAGVDSVQQRLSEIGVRSARIN